jgi:RNA polymerase sigma-70 factor (ECF subfamily)
MAASDESLIARIQAGDEVAFASLVKQYSGRLLRMALTFVKTKGVAEEVVQETWIAVLDGLSGFERRSSLKTWIFRILINRAKTRAEREARVVPFSALGNDPLEDRPSGASEPAVPPDRFTPAGSWATPPRRFPEDGPEGQLLRGELRQLLAREIEKLPTNQQRVVILRDVEGQSSEDVCAALEISEANQRVLLHRGRAKLRAAIERFFEEEGQSR